MLIKRGDIFYAEVPKNKPCKRNNRQISDNTKIAAKQGNAEELLTQAVR